MRRPYANPLLVRCERSIRPLRTLTLALEQGTLVIPDYQRGRVWTRQQQAAFIGYALTWAPLPVFVLRQVNSSSGFRDKLIDGQQRPMAMREWLAGDFAAVLPDGNIAWCTTRADCDALEHLGAAMIELPDGSTRRDAMGVYLALNSGGTPHTQAELDRVHSLMEQEP